MLPEGRLGRITMIFRCQATPPCLRTLREKIAGEFKALLTATEFDAFCLALCEACSNVIRHAYPEDAPGPLEIEIQKIDETLKVWIRDRGKPFDFSCCKGRPLQQVNPGGIGIHIIKAFFDKICSSRSQDGWNTLALERTRRTGDGHS